MSQDITDLIDGLSDAGRAEAAAIVRRLALIGELDALAATVCANDPRDHDRRDRIIARTATLNTEQQRQHQAWLTTQNQPPPFQTPAATRRQPPNRPAYSSGICDTSVTEVSWTTWWMRTEI